MTSLLWAHPFILPHYLEYFPFPVKGSKQAILFAYADGTLMLRREFDAILKRLLEFCGSSSFKGLSFRMGAATSAALNVRVRRAN